MDQFRDAASPSPFALNEIGSAAKYRHVFLTARDGLVIVDAESAKITDANQSIADLFGLSCERLIGLRLWEVEPLMGTRLGREGIDRVRTEGVVRFSTVSLQTRDRRFVEMEVVGSIIGGADNRTALFNFRDITEYKRSDRQSRTEANQEGLRVLVGGIAHDFNNLLTVIMG